MSRTDPWIIVGGGASGLATAFFLKQLGMDSVIIERDTTIGGRMGTVRLGDRTLDCGGKNIGRGYRLFRQFAASLGTHPLEYFGLNSSQAVNGRVRTFEASARWRTMLDLARGMSASDLVRFGRLLWSVKSDEATGYLGSPTSRRLGRQYDNLPADRYFSQEFCQRIIRPMSVRMNGAEPDEVYVGNLTSNVRMILDTYEQFTHGLAPLLAAFLGQYEVRVNTTTEGLLVKDGRVVGVRVRHADGQTSDLHGAGVILATPSSVAATLTEPILPDLTRQLRSIAYYPVALIIAEYDRPVFSSGARAFVFDGREVISNAGAYGVNDLHLVRYTFSGRASRRFISDSTDAEALLRLGEAALAKYVPVDHSRCRRFVAKHFSPGLCAYAPHHGKLIDHVDQERRKVAGLHLTGDYMQGASIEACFRSARACAHRLVGQEHKTARPVAS
jgi:protoporphyrinogen/coproporphyrinogen III oxidase